MKYSETHRTYIGNGMASVLYLAIVIVNDTDCRWQSYGKKQ